MDAQEKAMSVSIVPSTPTHRVGESVDVVVSDFGSLGEPVQLFLINGLDPDSDVLGEQNYVGVPVTFAGVIIPTYPTSGGGETNTIFKVVDTSTLDEDTSDPFTLLPAASAGRPPRRLGIGLGIGM
jgi:hypothetical protein